VGSQCIGTPGHQRLDRTSDPKARPGYTPINFD
jgi:hypothetical protein